MNRYGPVPLDLTPPPLSDEERSRLCRLPVGGCVERGNYLPFTFNGTRYLGLQGDTLASALLANRVSLVPRNWLLPAARAGLGADLEHASPLVQVLVDGGATLQLRMTELALFGGLTARSLPTRPAAALDALALTGLPAMAARLLCKALVALQNIWHAPERHRPKPSRLHASAQAASAPAPAWVFPKQDLPGVMAASMVSLYIRRFAVLPGRTAVVCTQSDAGYDAALALKAVGAQVQVIDARTRPAGPLTARAQLLGIPILSGHGLVAAVGLSALRAVRIRRLGRDASRSQAEEKIVCDLLAVAAGYSLPDGSQANAAMPPQPSKRNHNMASLDRTPNYHPLARGYTLNGISA